MYKHRASERELILNHQFQDFTGVETPEQFVQVKALTGDVSDNIPGVGGIGEKTAKKLLNDFGSVQFFIDAVAEDPKVATSLNKALFRFIANEPFEYRGKHYDPPIDVFERNLKLVDLSQVPRPTKSDIIYEKPSPDFGKFQTLASKLLIKSWLEHFDHWIQPFDHFNKEN